MILEDAFVVSTPLWPLARCCFCPHRSITLLLTSFQPLLTRAMFQSVLFWTVRLLSRLRLVARFRARLRACSASKCDPERALLSLSEAALYRRCIFTLLGLFTMYLLQVVLPLW